MLKDGFGLCFPLHFLLRLGDACDEAEKAFTVGLWRYRGNLITVMRQAFPEMLGLFDHAVLGEDTC
jgi:hypothetical protein